ncbi:GatB/YqeY domain-containing protein [Acidaminobacter sp. JC074]|uniref:GatB/YqeY domain-containing protein n=1 Tax=Acidaminobacter sp. JC074 TaxID=2530199 RepID=UPI001F0D15A1|nr:GatB/YqeY domain-containing protein [Acidaminobacter sp. JC074]MCH4887718.1 GatB/YqeY domain-containing protein [Acidaminobacter sp. JC074]
MSIKDQLMADLKEAMKQKQKLEKSVITMLRAAIKQVEVDKRVELSDDEVIDIVATQVKQKRSVIDEFLKGGREDLADEARAEISVLEKYLPEQLSEDELKTLISGVISEVNATSMKDMGKVMGIVNPQVKGRADGKTVSQIVKGFLN